MFEEVRDLVEYCTVLRVKIVVEGRYPVEVGRSDRCVASFFCAHSRLTVSGAQSIDREGRKIFR